MHQFLKTLSTLKYEKAYISTAFVEGRVSLVEDYWRLRLAMFFLREETIYGLPTALRSNFCPLFWFTNALVLLAPIWLAIFGVVKLCGMIWDGPIYYCIELVEAKTAKRQINKKSTKEQTKREKLRAVTFDERSVRFRDLEWGKIHFDDYIYVLQVRDVVKDSANIDWHDPRLLDHTLDEDVSYYVQFRKKYGSLYAEKYRDLEKEYEAQRLKDYEAAERRKQEKEAERLELTQLFASFFNWSKIFCKAILIVVGPLVTAWLAFWLYKGVVWVVSYLAGILSFAVLFGFLKIVGAAAVGIFLGILIVSRIKKVDFDGPAEFIVDVLAKMFYPFVLVGKKTYAIWDFCITFIRMFFSENCPGITIVTNEKNVQP